MKEATLQYKRTIEVSREWLERLIEIRLDLKNARKNNGLEDDQLMSYLFGYIDSANSLLK